MVCCGIRRGGGGGVSGGGGVTLRFNRGFYYNFKKMLKKINLVNFTFKVFIVFFQVFIRN